MTQANPSDLPTPTGSETEQTTPEGAPPAQVPEEAIKNHPLFKDLEGKHAAAEREKNRYKGRLEKVQKGITDEDEEKPSPAEESPYVTKEQLWEVQHQEDLEIYGDEQFQQDVARGIPRDYALETAKLRFQANPDKARLERHQAVAAGSATSVRNTQDDTLDGFNQADADRWGYTKETWLKQRELKKARGQI